LVPQQFQGRLGLLPQTVAHFSYRSAQILLHRFEAITG
jgi:hypothetical protein